MTLVIDSDMACRVGRKKRWHEIMGAPFPRGTFARMDAVRAKGESKTDLIRVAVERELKRREARRPARQRRRRIRKRRHDGDRLP